MRVLVACEFSGVVRRAFLARGHEAWSCDRVPAEDKGFNHIEADIMNVLYSDRPVEKLNARLNAALTVPPKESK